MCTICFDKSQKRFKRTSMQKASMQMKCNDCRMREAGIRMIGGSYV
ncbi:hypothetical protein GCWU000342_01372 [Shuttleworthella satelles DSM 14600]|uniref:Uncharacterized protein n=1 Tax=Shuttleworthella satelles DSM 14600 TaxID=626523 RepID=C4GBR9_9FIRM|nr:hypothetical protein GCWU000342_01372 [Shuttleworthia satelles DSM 14600]